MWNMYIYGLFTLYIWHYYLLSSIRMQLRCVAEIVGPRRIEQNAAAAIGLFNVHAHALCSASYSMALDASIFANI